MVEHKCKSIVAIEHIFFSMVSMNGVQCSCVLYRSTSTGCASSKPKTIAVVQFNNIAEIKMPATSSCCRHLLLDIFLHKELFRNDLTIFHFVYTKLCHLFTWPSFHGSIQC